SHPGVVHWSIWVVAVIPLAKSPHAHCGDCLPDCHHCTSFSDRVCDGNRCHCCSNPLEHGRTPHCYERDLSFQLTGICLGKSCCLRASQRLGTWACLRKRTCNSRNSW